jgi:hypothetical protein
VAGQKRASEEQEEGAMSDHEGGSVNR